MNLLFWALILAAWGGFCFLLGRLYERDCGEEPERGHVVRLPPDATITRRTWRP